MGSVFATKPDVHIVDSVTGDNIPTPFYIQFVPGSVISVVTSLESDEQNDPKNLNSIKAEPHILPSDKRFKDRISESEKNRYIPLFRGMTDVPVKGDPVLLCTIGKINYYLGPLNTDNVPTLNNDNLYIPRQDMPAEGQEKATETEAMGQSLNFVNTEHRRLSKKYKPELDGESITYNEIHGDQIFEGRHGNSIRIGSRDIYPYLILSNHRTEKNGEESLADGSLISITSNGTLQQHFSGYYDTLQEKEIPGFQLASDTVEGNGRTIGNMVQSVNLIDDSYPYIYEFGKPGESYVGGSNQILLHSDRITINSKRDNIFLSSINDIHLGAGRTLTISTKEDLIIESRNIYLGSPIKNKSNVVMEPMVLGNTLFEILEELTDALSKTMSMSPYTGGTTFPLMDSKKVLMSTTFLGIKKKLLNIKSNYHYIEPNDTTNKQ
tara:strand:+ start:134 stop:1444 length:1311 start_codon:yes stop_codon:yes gene_type:complete